MKNIMIKNLTLFFTLILSLPLVGQIPVNTPFELNSNNPVITRLVQPKLADTATMAFKAEGELVWFENVQAHWYWDGEKWSLFSGSTSITAGANITVTGTGDSGDPYVITGVGGSGIDADSIVSVTYANDTLFVKLVSGAEYKVEIFSTNISSFPDANNATEGEKIVMLDSLLTFQKLTAQLRDSSKIVIVIEGDSRSAPINSVFDVWSNHFTGWIAKKARVTNRADPGETTTQMVSQYATQVQPLRPNSASGEIGYLFLYGGVNDLIVDSSQTSVSIFNNLKSLWASARSDGFIVVAFTDAGRGTFPDSLRQKMNVLNDSIKANPELYDILIDTEKYLNVKNPANYYDELHHSSAGAKRLNDLVINALNGVTSFFSPDAQTTSSSGTYNIIPPGADCNVRVANVVGNLTLVLPEGTDEIVGNRYFIDVGPITVGDTLFIESYPGNDRLQNRSGLFVTQMNETASYRKYTFILRKRLTVYEWVQEALRPGLSTGITNAVAYWGSASSLASKSDFSYKPSLRQLAIGTNNPSDGTTINDRALVIFGGNNPHISIGNTSNRWISYLSGNQLRWASSSNNEFMVLTPTSLGLGGNFTPARTLEVRGEARISDLTTDNPTRLIGADADGDLGEVVVGGNLSLSASGLATDFGTPATGHYIRGTGAAGQYSVILEADLPDRPINAITGLSDTLAYFSRLTASATLDFPSIAADTAESLTVTVTGAAVGDVVNISQPGGVNDFLIYSAHVSSANTVNIKVNNVSGAAIDPASAVFNIMVWKYPAP